MTNDFNLATYLDEKTNSEDIPELDRLYGDSWRKTVELCESPIEKILFCFCLIEKPEDMLILPQREIKTRSGMKRVDFLIGLEGMRGDFSPMFIVECDGELHHTKPPDIANDKRRDREILLSWGLPTVRFTGTEIMSNPKACRVEVHQIFMKGRNL